MIGNYHPRQIPVPIGSSHGTRCVHIDQEGPCGRPIGITLTVTTFDPLGVFTLFFAEIDLLERSFPTR